MKEKLLDKDTIDAYHSYVQSQIRSDLNSISLGPGRLPVLFARILTVFGLVCLLVGVLLVSLRMQHVYFWDWGAQFVGPFFFILFLLCCGGATYLCLVATRRSNRFRRELYFHPLGDYGIAALHKDDLMHEQELKHDLKSGTTPHKNVKPRSEAYSQMNKQRREGQNNQGYRHGPGDQRRQPDNRRPPHPDDRRRGPPPPGGRRGPPPDDRRRPPDDRRGPPGEGRRGPPGEGRRGPPPEGDYRRGPPPGRHPDDRRGPPREGRRSPPPDGYRGPPREGRRSPPPEGFRGPPREGRRSPPPEGFRGPPREGRRSPPPEGFRGPPREGRRSPPPEGFRGPPREGRRSPPPESFRGPPREGRRSPPPAGYNGDDRRGPPPGDRRPRGVPHFKERSPDDDLGKVKLAGMQDDSESEL